MTETEILTSLTPETLRDLLQDAGCRAEIVAPPAEAPAGLPPLLRSATNGMAFEIRFADPMAIDAQRFGGFTLLAGLLVKGDLPSALVSRWNTERRFGRLFLQANMLVLVQDVTLAGGVTRDHLRAQLALWDRLIQELMHYLRAELAKMAESLSDLPVAEAGAA
jgi:hypothetical protein